MSSQGDYCVSIRQINFRFCLFVAAVAKTSKIAALAANLAEPPPAFAATAAALFAVAAVFCI
jgi:hypothetical protein